MGFFANLFRGSDDLYDKYTSSWLENSPEEELDEEYENIRQRHCSGDECAIRYRGMIHRGKPQAMPVVLPAV